MSQSKRERVAPGTVWQCPGKFLSLAHQIQHLIYISFADVSLQEVLQLKLCTWVISAGSIQSSSKINNLIQFLLLSLFIFW